MVFVHDSEVEGRLQVSKFVRLLLELHGLALLGSAAHRAMLSGSAAHSTRSEQHYRYSWGSHR